jgi:hypothetical protein
MRRATAATLLAWMVAASLLPGCSRTKEDLLDKARAVTTRAELERALGKPSEVDKLGPVEHWTYEASNGRVVFLILGDTVTLQATGRPADGKPDRK